MVTDDELRKKYAEIFDDIHAGDELKSKILKQHPKKRYPKPFIASAATVAAGIMIFAAVHNVTFDHNGNDDVISETVTTVDGTKPEKTPFDVIGGSEQYDKKDQQTEITQQDQKSDNVTNNAKTKKSEAATGSGTGAAASSDSGNKTNEQLEKEAMAKANSAYKKAESSVDRSSKSSQSSGNESQSIGSGSKYTVPSYSYSQDNALSSAPAEIEDNAAAESSSAGSSPAAEHSSGTSDTKMEADHGLRTGTEIVADSESASSSAAAYGGGGAAAQYSDSTPMISSASAGEPEMWDNKRYFNYIGKDIITCIESVEGFVYSGEDGGYFTVDETGEIYDDTRIFEFSNGTDTVILTSTTNTAIADVYMQNSDYTKRNINGKEAAILAQDGKYECYMTDGNVLYIIEVYTSDSSVFEAVLMSL